MSLPVHCFLESALNLRQIGFYQGLVMTGVWVIAHECMPVTLACHCLSLMSYCQADINHSQSQRPSTTLLVGSCTLLFWYHTTPGESPMPDITPRPVTALATKCLFHVPLQTLASQSLKAASTLMLNLGLRRPMTCLKTRLSMSSSVSSLNSFVCLPLPHESSCTYVVSQSVSPCT